MEIRINLKNNNILNNYYIRSLGIHKVKKDYYWDCSKRNDGEFSIFQFTLEGKGLLLHKDKIYTLKKNDIFFINVPSESIYYIPKTSDVWKILYFEVSKEAHFIVDKLQQLNDSPIINIEKYPKVSYILWEIYNESIFQEDNDTNSEILFVELITEIFNIFKKDKKVKKEYDLKKYIEKNYNNKNFNLDSFSKEVYISKYHLIRKFKKEYGITPIEYLNKYRLKIAVSLLLKTENSITEISNIVGFNSTNYFIKIFKKSYNMTPNVYRKYKKINY